MKGAAQMEIPADAVVKRQFGQARAEEENGFRATAQAYQLSVRNGEAGRPSLL
jgi:hypothetical protein